MRVFIYGTLKRGHRANHRLAGQSYLAEALTMPGYRLFDCGGFPGLVHDEEAGAVRGEIWEVEPVVLEQLDEYESVNQGLYERVEIMLEHGDTAITYLYRRPTDSLRDCGASWTLDQENPE